MSLGQRFHGRMVLVGGLVAVLFAACAKGNQTDQPPTGGGGSGGSGGGMVGPGIPPGEIGGTCTEDADCKEGTCTKVGKEKYCTVPCPPQCPDKTYCAIIDGDSICVPDLDSQCSPCMTVLQCLNPSDACLTAPAGDKFCARDCTTTGECPNGFTCVEGAKYPPKSTEEMPDGGAPDAGGSPDAGGPSDAGSDASPGDGGTGMPTPTNPVKWCVPNGTFSCPCNPKRDGVEKSCKNENSFGLCTGMEACNGETGKFEGCTAKVPAAESCNNDDDNCNGTKDEGVGNDLCASQGPPPPHAEWGCSAMGVCELGACQPGWANFPPGPVKDGCACPVEAGEPNDLCANATSAGSVKDVSGSSLVIAGTLSAQNDVDVWTFETSDTSELTTNSYHVSIDFVAPMPNNEFVMDVIRGASCNDTPSGGSANITQYDWCVDGKSADGTAGEAPCANDGTLPVHCNDNSSTYFVRVKRKLGAPGTCTQYSIQVTAIGGDPCDFTTQCQ